MSELVDDKFRKVRLSYLNSVKDPEVDINKLYEFIEKIEKEIPGVISDYKYDESMAEINDNELIWSDKYFDKQIKITEFNFSLKRINHLLKIRERFRENNVLGFGLSEEVILGSSFKDDNMPNNLNISRNLKKFVDEGDLLGIRTALRLDLNNNILSESDLFAGIDYAEKREKSLFESYEEKAFAREVDENKSNWSVDYYDNQLVYLRANFSKKRLFHLIKVRSLLREKGVDGFVAVEPKVKSSTSSIHQQDKQSERSEEQSPRANQSSEGVDPLFKTALKIGGAIAALAIILIAIIR